MSHESAFEAAQRARWMRPDACRWIRPDAARFLKPGMKLADVFPLLARKFRPDQPRIPAGQPGGGRWTDDWGSAPGTLSDLIKPIPAATNDDLAANLRKVGGGRRGGGSVGDVFPGASARQQSLLDQAMARSSSALAQIRQYDPDWKPRESSLHGRAASKAPSRKPKRVPRNPRRISISFDPGSAAIWVRHLIRRVRVCRQCARSTGRAGSTSIAPSTMSQIYSGSLLGRQAMVRLLPLRSMESCILG
jgi:hypothetical protein